MPLNYAKLRTNDGTYHGKKIDAVVDALRAVALNQGRGYMLRQTPLGTVLDIEPSKGGGGTICPFAINVVEGESPGTLDVTLEPGTVNNLLPTNYAEIFTVSASGLKYVKVTATSDGEKITSCELSIDTSDADAQDPAPFAMPMSFTIVIGILINDVPKKLIGCGSIQLTGHEQYREDKDPPAEPGELPYTPYYVWVASTF